MSIQILKVYLVPLLGSIYHYYQNKKYCQVLGPKKSDLPVTNCTDYDIVLMVNKFKRKNSC